MGWPPAEVELAGVRSAGRGLCVSVCLSLGGPVWPLGGDGQAGHRRQPKTVVAVRAVMVGPPSPSRGQGMRPRPPPLLDPEESRELGSGSR